MGYPNEYRNWIMLKLSPDSIPLCGPTAVPAVALSVHTATIKKKKTVKINLTPFIKSTYMIEHFTGAALFCRSLVQPKVSGKH